KDRYRLENLPFFAYGVSYLDIIEARPAAKGAFPTFVRVAKKSGHRTIRIILKPPSDRSKKTQAILDKLVEMGCTYEGADPSFIAVDIPKKVDFDGVCEFVEGTGQEWENGDPTFDELHPDE